MTKTGLNDIMNNIMDSDKYCKSINASGLSEVIYKKGFFMKRHVKLLPCILALLLLNSCGSKGAAEADTTTSATSETMVEATVTTTVTEPIVDDTVADEPVLDANTLYIVNEGQTNYTFVLPADSLKKPGGSGVRKNSSTNKMEKLSTELDTPLATSAMELVAALAEKTGVTIPLTNDAAVPSAQAGEYEVLIGLTDRAESIALHKKLKERTFAVQSTDKKLIIVGYDDNMTAKAIQYCLNYYVLGWDSIGQVIESGTFTVPANMNAVSPAEPQTPANTIHIGGKYTLKEATVFAEIAKDGNYKVMQGAATDGTYLYYCIENQALEAHESYIYKVDIATGKVVKRSKSLQLDHSNDMTYHPLRNQLIVVHNAPNRKLISFVDVTTLEKVETINIGREIFCMAYNLERDQYVVGLSGGQTFCVLNNNFEYVREYSPVASTGYTTQGMTCDENFLYFAQSGANVVVVYDWDGYQVDVVPIEFTNIETENICIVGNDIYIGFYRSGNGGIVYKTKLTVKK